MSISEFFKFALLYACCVAWGVAICWFLAHGVDNISIGGMTVALVDLLALELMIAKHD